LRPPSDEYAAHARILERIARETDGDVGQERQRLHMSAHRRR
jgi:hypothetical protein